MSFSSFAPKKKPSSGLYTNRLIFDRLLCGDSAERAVISDKNRFAEHKYQLYGWQQQTGRDDI